MRLDDLRRLHEHVLGDGRAGLRRATHTVRRVQRLTEWVREGDYDRILGGQYPRRGESDLRGDADKASEYYVDRMWNIYRDASDSAQGLRERFDSWRKRGED